MMVEELVSPFLIRVPMTRAPGRPLRPATSTTEVSSGSTPPPAQARGYERADWASAFRNVTLELTEEPLTPRRGAIPSELRGTLYRNGPGRLERGGQWVHHPFDGDGMVTAVRFGEEGARLSNRFVRTEGWLAEEKAGKPLFRGVFGKIGRAHV